MATDFIGPDSDLPASSPAGQTSGFVGPATDQAAPGFVGPAQDAALPEDIRGQMQNPDFWPSDDQWRTLHQAEADQPAGPLAKLASVGKGMAGIAALPGQAWDEAAAEASQGRPGHFLQREAAIVPEAAASLTRMVTDPVLNYLSAPGTLAEKAARLTVPGIVAHFWNKSQQTDEQKFQDWKTAEGFKLAKSRMPASAPWTRTWQEPVPDEDPEKSAVQPFPAASAIASFAAPVGALGGPALRALGGGARATEGGGLVKSAIEAAAEPAAASTGEKVLGGIGAAVDRAGGAVKAVSGFPRKVLETAADALVGPGPSADKVATIAEGFLLHVPGVEKIAAAEGIGQLVQKAGQFAQVAAAIPAEGPFSQFVNIAKNADTPVWIKQVAGSIVGKAGAAIAPAITSTVKGAVSGAAIGAGLNTLNDEDPWEGMGAGLLLGTGFGLAGAGEVKKAQVYQHGRTKRLPPLERND